MTISYNLDISSSSPFAFLKIIFRWRGSIWKSVMTEFVVWTICFFAVSLVYRNLLTPEQQSAFEAFAAHCDKKLDYIPLTFMLGFFVTIVVDRWKNMFNNMGFIENTALFVTTYIRGEDSDTRMKRRNIVRYLCLTQVLVFRDISMKVRKRFPNMESVVEAGFMQSNEKILFDKMNTSYTKYWIPFNWIFSIVYELRKEGKIDNDTLMNCLLQEVRSFRQNLGQLCNYDWVPVPLAYPQVVFLAVRMYFLICLISRQFIISPNAPNRSVVDVYVPFMTMLQLIFYMGWMKVAEALLNPLGEDDDDFEGNYLIDKNITTALCMVDEAYGQVPDQFRDNFKEGQTPLYSEKSASMPIHALRASMPIHALRGSVADVVLENPIEPVKMVPHQADNSENMSNASFPRMKSTEKLGRRIKERFSGLSRTRPISLPQHGGNNVENGDKYKPSRPKYTYSEDEDSTGGTPKFASYASSPVKEKPIHLETVSETTEEGSLERSESEDSKEGKEKSEEKKSD
uniref:Bestrophin homolog n=1 Tax=Steinernema glaseri TaxID=37863 RepID=A0A1I7YDV9_9BILA